MHQHPQQLVWMLIQACQPTSDTEETDERIPRLAALFTSWETAYDATKKVWRMIRSREPVAVNALVKRLPVSFAHFLYAGLQICDEAVMCGIWLDK
jgi:hypothetical protein